MQSLLGNGDAGVEVFGGLTVRAWLFSDLGLGSAHGITNGSPL